MKGKLFTLLGLTTTLLLTGCNSRSGGSENEIKFQVLKAGLGTEVYKALAKAYQDEHPGVKVKLIFNYDVNSDIDKHLSSGKCSDIYSIRDISAIRRYYAKQQIIDLTDTFNAPIDGEQTLIDLLDKSARDYCEYNGHYICVPEYMNVNGFVYNKKLFNQYGWTIPHTTEEMKTLMDKIISDTGDKVKPFVTCASADGYFYYLLNGINASYEGLANLENIYKFDTPEIFNPANRTGKLNAIQTMKDWYLEDNNYVIKGSLDYTHTQAQQDLLDGKAAMMLNGSWFENEMANYLDPSKHEMAMFPIPEFSEYGSPVHADGYVTKDNKQVISCEYTASYIIPSKAKNVKGAIDFLKFINRKDMCELYNKTCNSVRPLNYDKDSTSEKYATMSTFGKSVLDMANNCQAVVSSSKSQYVVSNGLTFWPLPSDPYHIKAMLRDGKTPLERLQAEYEYVKTIIK